MKFIVLIFIFSLASLSNCSKKRENFELHIYCMEKFINDSINQASVYVKQNSFMLTISVPNSAKHYEVEINNNDKVSNSIISNLHSLAYSVAKANNQTTLSEWDGSTIRINKRWYSYRDTSQFMNVTREIVYSILNYCLNNRISQKYYNYRIQP